MFPLRDDNPTTITPFFTWTLIAVNVLVFSIRFRWRRARRSCSPTGTVPFPPWSLARRACPGNVAVIPPAGSLFTSMFLHGGWMHLIGNMWFLWIFGNNIEEAMGRVRFLIFYLAAVSWHRSPISFPVRDRRFRPSVPAALLPECWAPMS